MRVFRHFKDELIRGTAGDQRFQIALELGLRSTGGNWFRSSDGIERRGYPVYQVTGRVGDSTIGGEALKSSL